MYETLMTLALGGVIWFLAWNGWKDRQEQMRREAELRANGGKEYRYPTWYESN